MVRQRLVTQITQIQDDGSELPVSAVTFMEAAGVERDVTEIVYLEDDGTGPFPLIDIDVTQTPPNPVSVGTLVTLQAAPEGGYGALTYVWTALPGAPPLSGTPGSATRTLTIPAGTADGMTFTYTVTGTDQSNPPRVASAAIRVGVAVIPPQPNPLAATLGQTPANPVPKGTVVTLRATPAGGTPSYNYVWSRVSPTGPAVSSTGPTANITIPSTLAAVTTWRYQCVVTDSGGNPQRVTPQIDVTGTPSTTPPTKTWPGLQAKPIIGMNVDTPSQWAARMSDVSGAGKIKARRIFLGGTLPASGMPAGKEAIIDQALDDGMLPVISFKDSGLSKSEGIAAATKLANILEAKAEALTITFWHEPNNDLTPAVFVQKQKDYMPLFKRPNISRGPILNGFLSENLWSTLTAFAPDELMAWGVYWEWMGSDNYQQGDMNNPSTPWSRRRTERMRAWLDSRGYTDWQFLIGEFNGFSADSVTDSVNGVLDPLNRVWVANMWNSGGFVLTGARLTAFRNALDDPRRY